MERDVIWSEKVRCSSKMKPRFRAEWEVSSEVLCIFGKLIFKSDEQDFSLRGVNSKKISSHPERDLLKSFLKVRIT